MHILKIHLRISIICLMLVSCSFSYVLASENNDLKRHNSKSVLTFAFAGDVCLTGDRYIKLPLENAYGYPFSNSADIFLDADLSILNLECCLSNSTNRVEKRFTFKGKPEYASLLNAAGIDYVSLANNHTADFGRSSLTDTMLALKRYGIGFAGAGESASASLQPSISTLKGNRIAFLAASDIIPFGFAATNSLPGIATARPLEPLLDSVNRSAANNNLVIVMMHWGIEREKTPSQRQIEMARRLIDAGADIVVGSHPHVWQPIEIYKNKLIFYSLGNFIFFPGNYEGRLTGILKVSLSQNEVFLKIIPYYITPSGEPVRATGQLENLVLRHLQGVLEISNITLAVEKDSHGAFLSTQFKLEKNFNIVAY